MSYFDLIMFTSGFVLVAFASTVIIRSLGELFKLDLANFLAGLSAICIAFFVNAIGCLWVWMALK